MLNTQTQFRRANKEIMAPNDVVITREDLKTKEADVSAITANFPGDPLP